MKKIGEGFYYSVFDLGNGRVAKKLNSHKIMYQKLMRWYGTTRFRKIKRALGYPYYVYQARKSLALSPLVAKINPEIFGNPTFSNRYEYEQDKAIVLEEYFRAHSLAENKKIFDQYIILFKKLWSFGYSDTVFNFTINNGVSSKTGELIFIDFNEFTRSKQAIITDIESKKWLQQSTLTCLEAGSLKEYIVAKIETEITVTELEKRWKVSE